MRPCLELGLQSSRLPRARLGNSGVDVSVLGIGTGTFGFGFQSLQARMRPEELGAMLGTAYEIGITWWDTSDDYGTHSHIRAGLDRVIRERVQISTKTHALTAVHARKSLEQARRELGVDVVDIYLLHEVDSPAELIRRRGAFEELLRARENGRIRAVGLSTHNIDTLEACTELEGLDVVMTNFNRYEDHMDAGLADYVAALTAHFQANRGILVMKAIGEGRLAHVAAESLGWNLEQPFVDAVLVGMTVPSQMVANAQVARITTKIAAHPPSEILPAAVARPVEVPPDAWPLAGAIARRSYEAGFR